MVYSGFPPNTLGFGTLSQLPQKYRAITFRVKLNSFYQSSVTSLCRQNDLSCENGRQMHPTFDLSRQITRKILGENESF